MGQLPAAMAARRTCGIDVKESRMATFFSDFAENSTSNLKHAPPCVRATQQTTMQGGKQHRRWPTITPLDICL
jgi:hypothetical protein